MLSSTQGIQTAKKRPELIKDNYTSLADGGRNNNPSAQPLAWVSCNFRLSGQIDLVYKWKGIYVSPKNSSLGSGRVTGLFLAHVSIKANNNTNQIKPPWYQCNPITFIAFSQIKQNRKLVNISADEAQKQIQSDSVSLCKASRNKMW